MRKLLAGILLTTALPAVASITSELAAGESSVADVVNGAMAACGGGSSCTEAALAETVTAGVDITAVINIATASGMDAIMFEQFLEGDLSARRYLVTALENFMRVLGVFLLLVGLARAMVIFGMVADPGSAFLALPVERRVILVFFTIFNLTFCV